MNGIDPKALEHACQCAGRSVHHFDRMALDLPLRASIIAHARAIEQYETFKQEVSAMLIDEYGEEFCRDHSRFVRFILPKTDEVSAGLALAIEDTLELVIGDEDVNKLRAALAARGLEVRKIGEGE